MTTVLARKPEPVSHAIPSTVPEIDPSFLKLEWAGSLDRVFSVILPSAFRFSDIPDVAAWRRVQAGGWALRRGDEVRLRSFSDEWRCRVYVLDANSREVTLSKPFDHVEMISRNKALYRDSYAHVEWRGDAVHGVKNSGGLLMTPGFPTEKMAIAALASCSYPKDAE